MSLPKGDVIARSLTAGFGRLRTDEMTPTATNLWRKTGASLPASEKDYADLVQHWLGHAPATVAERQHPAPPLARLADAGDWLGRRYGFPTDPDRLAEAKRRLC